jgi:dephospho-CoA kinase
MLRVGLTGGIATGKSVALARFAAAGCHTLDLDRVAHEVMAPGAPAYAAVVAEFGREILDDEGRIDRRRLGERVFADAPARARLNAIVHPLVRAEERRRAAALARPGGVLVTDAALLIEAGMHLRFDRLVVVFCDREEQLRRLMNRNQLDRAAAERRLAAQMPALEKRRFAHVALDTSGPIEETAGHAERAAGELLRLAQTQPAPIAVDPARAAACLARAPRDERVPPEALLLEIARARGIDLPRLASALGKPPQRPWYEGAGELADLAAFVAPAVLFTLARAGRDHEFLFAALASLARLLGTADAGHIADCCLSAASLAEQLAGSAGPIADAPARALAERWAGATPTRGERGVDWTATLRDIAGAPEIPEGIQRAVAELAAVRDW